MQFLLRVLLCQILSGLFVHLCHVDALSVSALGVLIALKRARMAYITLINSHSIALLATDVTMEPMALLAMTLRVMDRIQRICSITTSIFII